MVAGALRQGAALLATSSEPQESQRRREGNAGAAFLGEIIEAELSARAERSGWNTTVHFLEKTGAVRLRLVRQQAEEGGDNRPRNNGGGGGGGSGG